MTNYYGMYQPSYTQGYNYNTQQYQQMPQINNQMIMNNEPSIQMCDTKDYVKSQNARMDGVSSYYALADGSSIFCKKINPQTGASMLLTYKLQQEDGMSQETNIVGVVEDLKKEVLEIKNMILESLTSPTSKGGDK